MSRVDEGGEDLSALFAFRWIVSAGLVWPVSLFGFGNGIRLGEARWDDSGSGVSREDLHDRDDGRGLLIPILTALKSSVDGGRNACRRQSEREPGKSESGKTKLNRRQGWRLEKVHVMVVPKVGSFCSASSGCSGCNAWLLASEFDEGFRSRQWQLATWVPRYCGSPVAGGRSKSQ